MGQQLIAYNALKFGLLNKRKIIVRAAWAYAVIHALKFLDAGSADYTFSVDLFVNCVNKGQFAAEILNGLQSKIKNYSYSA